MVVDGAGRKVGEHLPRGGDARLAIHIGEPQHGVGVGDVEIMTDQHHPEGRLQVVDEDAPRVRDPVAVGVPQQGDAVAPLAGRARDRLDLALDVILRPVDRSLRPVALHHQHVAVRQGVDHSGMQQACGEDLDPQVLRDLGRRAPGPANRGGDLHRRQQVLVRRRKLRIWADLGARRLRGGPAGGEQGDGCGGAARPKDLSAHRRCAFRSSGRTEATTPQSRQPTTSRIRVTMAEMTRPSGTTPV